MHATGWDAATSAAPSVDVRHAIKPLGDAAVMFGRSLSLTGAQETVHVVTKLTDGVFNTGDVQPADDDPEELRGGREGEKSENQRERE